MIQVQLSKSKFGGVDDNVFSPLSVNEAEKCKLFFMIWKSESSGSHVSKFQDPKEI